MWGGRSYTSSKGVALARLHIFYSPLINTRRVFGPPSYFALVTSTIQAIVGNTSSRRPEWGGFALFSRSLYAGGAIFGGAEIARRPAECVETWGDISRIASGGSGIDMEKATEAWARIGEWLVLGFWINTENATIDAPPVRVECAALFAPSAEFSSP